MSTIVPIYEGSKKDSRLRHGKGRYQYHYAGFVYDGDWNDGVKHGRGAMTLPDGSVYDGDFLEGEMTGRGVRVWPSGASYDGELFRGERNGKGTFTYPDGTVYSGDWVEQKRCGKGKMTLVPSGDVYEGEFEGHHFNGSGVYVNVKGDRFQGAFKEGVRNGEGQDVLANGSTHVGKWREGKRAGSKGTFQTSSGLVYLGRWDGGIAKDASDRVVATPSLNVELLAAEAEEAAAAAAGAGAGKSGGKGGGGKTGPATNDSTGGDGDQNAMQMTPDGRHIVRARAGGALPPITLTCSYYHDQEPEPHSEQLLPPSKLLPLMDGNATAGKGGAAKGGTPAAAAAGKKGGGGGGGKAPASSSKAELAEAEAAAAEAAEKAEAAVKDRELAEALKVRVAVAESGRSFALRIHRAKVEEEAKQGAVVVGSEGVTSGHAQKEGCSGGGGEGAPETSTSTLAAAAAEAKGTAAAVVNTQNNGSGDSVEIFVERGSLQAAMAGTLPRPLLPRLFDSVQKLLPNPESVAHWKKLDASACFPPNRDEKQDQAAASKQKAPATAVRHHCRAQQRRGSKSSGGGGKGRGGKGGTPRRRKAAATIKALYQMPLHSFPTGGSENNASVDDNGNTDLPGSFGEAPLTPNELLAPPSTAPTAAAGVALLLKTSPSSSPSLPEPRNLVPVGVSGHQLALAEAEEGEGGTAAVDAAAGKEGVVGGCCCLVLAPDAWAKTPPPLAPPLVPPLATLADGADATAAAAAAAAAQLPSLDNDDDDDDNKRKGGDNGDVKGALVAAGNPPTAPLLVGAQEDGGGDEEAEEDEGAVALNLDFYLNQPHNGDEDLANLTPKPSSPPASSSSSPATAAVSAKGGGGGGTGAASKRNSQSHAFTHSVTLIESEHLSVALVTTNVKLDLGGNGLLRKKEANVAAVGGLPPSSSLAAGANFRGSNNSNRQSLGIGMLHAMSALTGGVGSVVSGMSKLAEGNLEKLASSKNACVSKIVVTLIGVGDVCDLEFQAPSLNTKYATQNNPNKDKEGTRGTTAAKEDDSFYPPPLAEGGVSGSLFGAWHSISVTTSSCSLSSSQNGTTLSAGDGDGGDDGNGGNKISSSLSARGLTVSVFLDGVELRSSSSPNGGSGDDKREQLAALPSSSSSSSSSLNVPSDFVWSLLASSSTCSSSSNGNDRDAKLDLSKAPFELMKGQRFGCGVACFVVYGSQCLGALAAAQNSGVFAGWRALELSARNDEVSRVDRVSEEWVRLHPPPTRAQVEAKKAARESRARSRGIARRSNLEAAALASAPSAKPAAGPGKASAAQAEAKGDPNKEEDNEEDLIDHDAPGDEDYSEEEDEEGANSLTPDKYPEVRSGMTMDTKRTLMTSNGSCVFEGIQLPALTLPGEYEITISDESFPAEGQHGVGAEDEGEGDTMKKLKPSSVGVHRRRLQDSKTYGALLKPLPPITLSLVVLPVEPPPQAEGGGDDGDREN